MKNHKIIAILSIIISFLSKIHAVEILTKAEPAENQYVLYIEAYDWGAGANKIVLNAARPFSQEQIDEKDFSVTVNLPITSRYFSFVNEKVNVEQAYPSDSYGNRVKGKSNYITLLMPVSKDITYSDPFVHSLFNIVTNSIDISSCAYLSNNIYNYNIKNEALRINIYDRTAAVNELAGQFKIDSIAAKKHEVCLEYAYWESEKRKDDEKCPLVLWLHGMGEVGSNPYLPLLGTKACYMISDEIQRFFPEGFDLLVPQCPTGWLETEDSDFFGTRIWAPVDIQTPVERYAKPVLEFLNMLGITPGSGSSQKQLPPDSYAGSPKDSVQERKKTASTSYYTTAVKKVIDAYIAEHPYIDLDRIYVGGCSAGGYMTMNMLIEYPALFAAGFPVCEVYPDSKILDRSIKQLAYIPLWFTHAKNDRTVNYKTHSFATVERLKKQGAENLHYSLFDDVHDLSGKYMDDEGNPLEYDGHCSWIYVLNNQCKENGKTIFEWLSEQKR